MKKIDDKAYVAGQKMFRKGGTLRSVVEPMMTYASTDDEAEYQRRHSLSREERDAEESRLASTALGFADGALDAIRGLRRG